VDPTAGLYDLLEAGAFRIGNLENYVAEVSADECRVSNLGGFTGHARVMGNNASGGATALGQGP